MPDKILAIVPEDFVLGFKLAGLDTKGCASLEEAKESLANEMSHRRYGLVLIDEEFFLSFDIRFKKRLQETTLPLIMPIPLKKGFKEEAKAKDYFLKMVHDAIGYEIRIK